MGKFVTMNFSGKFIIEGKRATGKDAIDQYIYSPEIAVCPTRMGTDSKGKVIGFFDTDTMLSHDTKEACKAKWGDNWLATLDAKIDKGPFSMRLLKEGETIEINDIPMDAMNAADRARLPHGRHRATIIQGVMTASALPSNVPSKLTVTISEEKVVDKMQPSKKEKVKE